MYSLNNDQSLRALLDEDLVQQQQNLAQQPPQDLENSSSGVTPASLLQNQQTVPPSPTSAYQHFMQNMSSPQFLPPTPTLLSTPSPQLQQPYMNTPSPLSGPSPSSASSVSAAHNIHHQHHHHNHQHQQQHGIHHHQQAHHHQPQPQQQQARLPAPQQVQFQPPFNPSLPPAQLLQQASALPPSAVVNQQQQQQQQIPPIIVDTIELNLNNRMNMNALYVPSFVVQDLTSCNIFAAQNVLQLAQQFDSNSPSVVHIADRNLPDFNELFVSSGGATSGGSSLANNGSSGNVGGSSSSSGANSISPPKFRIFDEASSLISFHLLQECSTVKLNANILFSQKCCVWYDLHKHRWVVGSEMPSADNIVHPPPSFISWVPSNQSPSSNQSVGNNNSYNQSAHHHGGNNHHHHHNQQLNNDDQIPEKKRKREGSNDSKSSGSPDDTQKKKQRKQRHVKKVGEVVKDEQGKHIVVVEVAQLQFIKGDQKTNSDYYLPAGRVGDLADFLTRDRTSIFRAATRNAFEDDAFPDGVYLTKDTAKKFNHEIGDTFHNYCGVHGRHDASVLIRLELLKEFVKHGYELQPVVIFTKQLYLQYESAGKRWIASESL